ncbi:phosphatase PAP2 family protein [Phyllobacterium phragmitis]|uniref:Phosphatase PAP2 family protein n=1 Tax=Phyllobacterium phragmitis TaxID=2670329 RepID=A0ABQ0GYD5_9HYPH
MQKKMTIFRTNLRQARHSLVKRLRSPVPPDAPSPWTWSMTAAAILVLPILYFLHPYDGAILRAVSSSDMPGLWLLRDLTDVGRTLFYLLIAFCVLLWTTGKDRRTLEERQRTRIHTLESQAAFALAAVGLSAIIVYTVKFAVGRARPALIDTLGPNFIEPFRGGHLFASFPSGHSATVGAVTVILALWFPRWRLPVLLATLALAFSRIAVAAHYPTDVVAGFSIGCLTTLFLARFLANRNAGYAIDSGRLLPKRRVLAGKGRETLR